MSDLRQTPLYQHHVSLQAKVADFGGWAMPIEYSGVMVEHEAVRTDVGIFDVSHMGKLRITGPGALDAVNAIVVNDLQRIGDGQAQYSMLCTPEGGVIDDLIVYRVSEQEIRIVPNASNADAVVAELQSLLPQSVALENNHERFGILAIQGPNADRVMQAIGLPHGHAYMSFVDAEYRGAWVMVCRTGYTGERGYELMADNHTIVALWEAATAAGALPVGLGARDTLRTEMGYPLHGHELSTSITPVMARLGWAVGWNKPEFRGRETLLQQKADGVPRTLRGLRALDRGIPRGEMTVYGDEVGGLEVGVTTSGTFSPSLKTGIALAFLDTSLVEGAQVVIDVRGRPLLCEIVKPPFVTGTSAAS